VLGPGRYLLGVLEILLLGGFAWLGGTALRRWLLPRFVGAPAGLGTAAIALPLLIWPAELLGSFGAFDSVPYLMLVAAVGIGCWKFAPRPPERGESHPHLQVRVRLPSLRLTWQGPTHLPPHGDEQQLVWRRLKDPEAPEQLGRPDQQR
jgi:hypothetical protein